jgi:hypothetical protein
VNPLKRSLRTPQRHQPIPSGSRSAVNASILEKHPRSDASLSMQDRNVVDASFFRPNVSLRRGWHHAATFDTQAFEIVPKTKHGRVHIATPRKTVTESHHVWSARRQDLFQSSFSRASVSRDPRGCDRNKGGGMARRAVSPTRSSLLAQQNSLKLHNLQYCSLPRKYCLFRKVGRPHRHERPASFAGLPTHRCIGCQALLPRSKRNAGWLHLQRTEPNLGIVFKLVTFAT